MAKVIQKVTNPQRKVTDDVVLGELKRQGIDKDYVEFFQDYAPRSLGKGHSPYAKFYRDLKSGKRFMVVSGLPMVKAMGHKIEVGWLYAKGKYYSKANLFSAIIDGKQVQLTCLSDQPTGAKENDRATWLPQLFLNGIEQSCGEATLLPTDPINENYHDNILEWDYGICKRRIRLIEGRFRERWVFTSNPQGEVRIKHNFSGNLPVKLGEYAVSDDEELVSLDTFNKATYPVEIGASSTFYPDAHEETSSVDGDVYHEQEAGAWGDLVSGVGTGANDIQTSGYPLRFVGSYPGSWTHLSRAIYLFDTSGLHDDAVISAAILSIRGYDKISDVDPTVCIYSSNPTSNIALVAGDYDSLGSTPYSGTISHAVWSTVGFNDFTLNAAGRAAISKTGVSKFGTRCSNYDVANAEPVSDIGINHLAGYFAEIGVPYKPKLVVTYTIVTDVTVEPPLIAVDSEGKVPSLVRDSVLSAPKVRIGQWEQY